MKKILLTNSDKVALIDDEDFEKVNQYKWQLDKYSVVSNDKHLHRFILNLGPINQEKTNLVDHKDRNFLNNQKENLRICNSQQNACNRKKRKDSNTNYKGVCKRDGKYCASIGYNNKQIKIGYYLNEKDAAIAYDFYAKQLFKDFACLNFPDNLYNDYYLCVEKNRCKSVKKYKYIGVVHYQNKNIWYAKLKVNKKFIHIGRFKTEIEAAYARDKLAIEYLGSKAKLNFPDKDYTNYIINKLP